jgi:hypothetical protein
MLSAHRGSLVRLRPAVSRRSSGDEQAEALEARLHALDSRRWPARAADGHRRPRGRGAFSAALIAIGFVCDLRAARRPACELAVDRRGLVRGRPRGTAGPARRPAARRRACGRRCRRRRPARGTAAARCRRLRRDRVRSRRCAGLVEIGIRLLDGADGLDLGETADRVGLDVDDDARRDVVDDDRACRWRGDRLEVRDDPRCGGLL